MTTSAIPASNFSSDTIGWTVGWTRSSSTEIGSPTPTPCGMRPPSSKTVSNDRNGSDANISSPALPTWIQLYRFTTPFSVGTTPMIAARPSISPVSAMIDPTALPSAMPGSPRAGAITVTSRAAPLTTIASVPSTTARTSTTCRLVKKRGYA